MTSDRRVSRSCSGRRPAKTASRICQVGCDGGSQVSRGCDVSRSLEPDSWLARTEGCLRHAVLRETGEEPFEGPLPILIVNRSCTLFLQDFATMDPQDVVDTTDRRTLSEEGKFRLGVLAELNVLVRCADDICLAQELVRDELPRPSSNSERDAAVVDGKGFGQAPHVANSPLGWRCVQIAHVVDDFCFQRGSLSSDSSVGDVEVLKKNATPGLGGT